MRIKVILFIIIGFLIIPFAYTSAAAKTTSLNGRILLQVESHGEAWYVNPKDSKRYYLADGNDAFEIMRKLGVGISNANLEKIKNSAEYRKKFMGKIFLQVESHGEAYYISFDGRYNYLKDGTAAYEIMRKSGLGITNTNLNKITSSNTEAAAVAPVSSACVSNKNCEKYRGVEIAWQTDADAFSAMMSSQDISGTNLDLNLAPVAVKLVKKALDKYPEGILNRYLHRVYVLNSLSVAGKSSLGTVDAFKRDLYLTNTDRPEKTEGTLHHELAHLIYENKNIYYPEFESLWQANNSKEFTYGNPYFYSYPGENITAFKDSLGKNAFLTMYSETNFKEDFAVITSHMFINDSTSLNTDFWTVLSDYSLINEKYKLAVDFYKRLNPIFTDEYFRKVSKE